MYWDLEVARHSSWYTVHAVSAPGLLLCGRARDTNYESVVNPPDSHPVCRVCRARIRGRVEQARQISRHVDSDPPEEDADETSECEGSEAQSRGTRTPSSPNAR